MSKVFAAQELPFAGAGESIGAFSVLASEKDSPAGISDSSGFAFPFCSRNFVHSAANSSQPSLKGLTVIQRHLVAHFGLRAVVLRQNG
jgi:hypothetical protein